MKVLAHPRTMIYEVLNAHYKHVSKSPVVVEVGVLRGENAQDLLRILRPSQLLLIDCWSAEPFKAIFEEWRGKSWIKAIEDPRFQNYFGGSPVEQSTYDSLFSLVQKKFEAFPEVQIIRQDSISAIEIIEQRGLGGEIDLIYLDASHSYETVFHELMIYKDTLSQDGCIQLNDCCHSDRGVEQNLGVLEAVTKFLKMTNFLPVCITNTDWSDLLLAKRDSAVFHHIDSILKHSNLNYVELPPQLLGAARVVYGGKSRLSFL